MKKSILMIAFVASFCFSGKPVSAEVPTEIDHANIPTYEVYGSPLWVELKRLRAEMEAKLGDRVTWMGIAEASFNLMLEEQAAAAAANTVEGSSALDNEMEKP